MQSSKFKNQQQQKKCKPFTNYHCIKNNPVLKKYSHPQTRCFCLKRVYCRFGPLPTSFCPSAFSPQRSHQPSLLIPGGKSLWKKQNVSNAFWSLSFYQSLRYNNFVTYLSPLSNANAKITTRYICFSKLNSKKINEHKSAFQYNHKLYCSQLSLRVSDIRICGQMLHVYWNADSFLCSKVSMAQSRHVFTAFLKCLSVNPKFLKVKTGRCTRSRLQCLIVPSELKGTLLPTCKQEPSPFTGRVD